MSDSILFLRVAADRIGAPGPDRIVGKNAIPGHQCRHLVLNHPDRREDGRHSKANARRAVSSHTQWAGRVPHGESRPDSTGSIGLDSWGSLGFVVSHT